MKHPTDNTEPETLLQMLGMMSPKPAQPIADPTTVAMDRVYRIYMDMKNKVLLGDRQPGSVLDAITEAKIRTEKEVVLKRMRKDAVKRYDLMLDRLNAGGEIQL